MKTVLLRTALAIAILTTVAASTFAEQQLRFAGILADNMVLQRDKPICIWGVAAPGAEVKVTLTEDAKLAGPVVAKAPKGEPPVIDHRNSVPPPAAGEYHAEIRYVDNAKPVPTTVRTVTAGADGAWEVEFPAMGTSFTPKFILAESGGEAAAVSNVLIGVVWLNTGQSNIERKGFNGSDLEYPSARMNGIRYTKLDGSWYKPLADLRTPAQWLVCSPQTACEIPGVSYYFALYLHRYLNVPVGIINNARGGTTGQAWCSRGQLEAIDGPVFKKLLPEYDAQCKPWESESYREKMRAEQVAEAQAVVDEYEKAVAAWKKLPADQKAKTRKPKPPKLKATKALRVDEVMGDPRESWTPPAGLFNAVVNPLRKLAVEGMIYYQGENNNFGLWSRYELTFPRVITSHRELFGPKMPIGVIGLPGWKQIGTPPEVATVADGYAIIRDIHNRTAAKFDGVDVIHTYDCGGPGIHPGDKEPVGRRAARWALANVYGKDLFSTGPVLRDVKKGTNKAGRKVIKLYFTLDPFVQKMIDEEKARRGDPNMVPAAWLTLPVPRKSWPYYEGFIIAGADRRWYPADVERNGEPALEVSSRFVDDPVAVRYAWGNRPKGNAVGFREMPLPSFRTDDWPLPESWKYDKALVGANDEEIKRQVTLGWRQAYDRQMAEHLIALGELDAKRYLGKGERSPRAFLRSKADRIAAVIADLRESDQQLHARRGGNPEIGKKLTALEKALKAVEAEIDKLAE